jgi:xanthine dehydrogenase accessory factor
MSIPGSLMLRRALAGEAAVWVRVESALGSVPRESGASMLVDASGLAAGTIGGGRLEFEAMARARRMLDGHERTAMMRLALGPSLGQCCGGSVTVSFRWVDADELPWIAPLAALEQHGGVSWLSTTLGGAACPHSVVTGSEPEPDSASAGASASDGVLVSRLDSRPWPIWVFGAGHVGEALVRVLATLPSRITWVDPRGSQFPAGLPANVDCVEADSPAHEVRAVPPGADVLVMTHSHALDFDLCVALLARDDLGQIGLIGSHTKAASFRGRLARRGIGADRIARLQCPIGAAPGGDPQGRHTLDRQPGAIAVSVAFDLWRRRRALQPAPQDAATPTPTPTLDSDDGRDALRRVPDSRLGPAR